MNFAQSNIESLGMDCPGAKKSSIRISQIKKVQQQNLPHQKSPVAESPTSKKVQQQNVFLVSSILPKNEQKKISFTTTVLQVILFSFFGRIDDTKKTFRN